MARPQYRQTNGFDASLLLPLGVLVVVILMAFIPMMAARPVTYPGTYPMYMNTSRQKFSVGWVVPAIIVAALVLTSSELLAPSQRDRQGRHITTAYGYRGYLGPYHGNYIGGQSPSWALLGLMLVILFLLPWRY